MNTGTALFNLNRNEEAIAVFNDYLQLRPDNPDGWSNLWGGGDLHSEPKRLNLSFYHF